MPLEEVKGVRPHPQKFDRAVGAACYSSSECLKHKGPMRGYYPYEIEQKKGSYFPILGSIVVINQAIEFLETYGLLRN